MTAYKCKDCSHEIESSTRLTECDICGGFNIVSLEEAKATRSQPAEAARYFSSSERPSKNRVERLALPTKEPTILRSSSVSTPARSSDKSTGLVIAGIFGGLSVAAISLVGYIAMNSTGGYTPSSSDRYSQTSDDLPVESSAKSCIGVLHSFLSFEGPEPIEGAFVTETMSFMPAAREGLAVGDLIVEVNGEPVTESSSLSAIQDTEVGGSVYVSVIRPSAYSLGTGEEGDPYTITSPYQQLYFEIPTEACPPS